MVRAPSEELRRRVWEERIAAHTRNIYFARLAVRYRRFERGLGVATAVFSSATVTAALGDIGVGPLWPAVAAGVFRHPGGSSRIRGIGTRHGQLLGRLGEPPSPAG